jgi:hypothetical protein
MTKHTLLALLLLTLGWTMGGCGKLAPRPLTQEAELRSRCIKLGVTCEIQWNSSISFSYWSAWAYNSKPWPSNSDYWFGHGGTRAEAIDDLYGKLGGDPTNPGNPLPEIIYRPTGGPQ